jgi:hypothetical protein
MKNEIAYKKPNFAPPVLHNPIMRGTPECFELTTVEGLEFMPELRLQSTYAKSKGKSPLGSNLHVESAWNHFNKDLMDRIRAIKESDENNLRAI